MFLLQLELSVYKAMNWIWDNRKFKINVRPIPKLAGLFEDPEPWRRRAFFFSGQFWWRSRALAWPARAGGQERFGPGGRPVNSPFALGAGLCIHVGTQGWNTMLAASSPGRARVGSGETSHCAGRTHSPQALRRPPQPRQLLLQHCELLDDVGLRQGREMRISHIREFPRCEFAEFKFGIRGVFRKCDT